MYISRRVLNSDLDKIRMHAESIKEYSEGELGLNIHEFVSEVNDNASTILDILKHYTKEYGGE